MKAIYERFTDDEFEALLKVKNKMSWHEFILKLLDYIEDEKEDEEQNGTGQHDGF